MIELPSPCLVVLVGPPGSGKSSWAAEHLPDTVVSSDDLRAQVGEGRHDLRATADAFDVLDQIVDRRLRRRLTTVIDTLGGDADRRARWRAMADARGVPCVAMVFDVPAAQVRRQNRARPHRVPDAVLDAQLAAWPGTVAAVDLEPFAAVHRAEPASLVPEVLHRRTTSAARGAATPRVAPATMRFGLHVPVVSGAGGPPAIGGDVRAIARAAEQAGVDGIWLMDHMRQIPMHGPPWADVLESWTTLAHIAGATETLRVGTLVTALTFRNVAHLGKIVATLDVLSGGRVDVGLGLGWNEDEHRAYGWTLPSVADRYALLDDALELLPQLWGPGAKPFRGRVLHVPDTTCYPRPLQARVPVLVGGSGDRTLRSVAQHADACNLFGDPATVAQKVAVLHRHCAEFGRDPSEISVSHLSTVMIGDDAADVRRLVEATRPSRSSAERHARAVNAGTIDQHLERLERYRDAGVDHVIVGLADLHLAEPADAIERYGRVIERWRSSRADDPSG